MPKRILDDSLLDSRSLEVLSPGAQDAFPRFILLADDFGCFELNVTKLRANGWSRRPDVTETMVDGWVREYAEKQAVDPDTGDRLAPVLMTWTHVGRRYAYLTGWHGPHGQKRRDEYGPTKPHGSKRKTPAPPADLLAEVMAGNVRAVDGKPPGTDREPTGNDDSENSNNSVPAREMTGTVPGNDRDDAGRNTFPAPAVPDAVPDAGAGAGKTLAPSPSASTPVPALFESESPVAAVLPCSGSAKAYGVTLSQIASWQSAYPGVDVLVEVERARVWLEANTTRRKTHGGMARFLVAWMNRAQDSPRGKPAARAATVAAAPASAFTGGKREF